MASDSEGNFVVVWQSYGSFGSDQDEYSIQARRFGADGTPLDPVEFQVNTYTTDYQQRPAVAMAPSGDFVVVWDSWGADGDDSYYSVQARRFAADGTPLDPTEFLVNAYTTHSQFYPSVAMDARGNFVVAWQSDVPPAGPYIAIEARRFAADGAPLDPSEFRVDTLGEEYPRQADVAAASDGRFVVAWNVLSLATGRHIRARRFAADGTPLDPTEHLVDTAGNAGLYDATSVAVDAEANFVVAWDTINSLGNDNSYRSVQVRRYRADGTPVDAQEYQANVYTTGSQGNVEVASAPDGDFVAVWQSRGSFGNDTSYWSVQARRFGRGVIPVTSTSGGTGGPGCTLRDAIAAANAEAAVGGCPAGNGGGVVELPAGATIALTEVDNGVNALPVVTRPVTIRGRGARIERDPGLACPAGAEMRLFEVVDGGVLSLEDVAVSNGCLLSAPGAGVLASGGTVILREASIEGNETGSDGGGSAVVDGSLLAFDSTLRGNLSGGSGGGTSIAGDPGWLLLRGSTVSENGAANGGGLAFRGIAPGLVDGSTVSGNEAAASGGGILIDAVAGRLQLEFATLTDNAALDGAGARMESGVLSLHGSLLGDNLAGADCAAGAGTMDATGLNLDTDGSCAALAGGGIATVASLGLGPLADNSGPSRSHLPLAGSPALDAAPSCSTSTGAPVLRDQRGYPRPTDDDGDGAPACELGSVERGPLFLDGFESGDATRWSAFAGSLRR